MEMKHVKSGQEELWKEVFTPNNRNKKRQPPRPHFLWTLKMSVCDSWNFTDIYWPSAGQMRAEWKKEKQREKDHRDAVLANWHFPALGSCLCDSTFLYCFTLHGGFCSLNTKALNVMLPASKWLCQGQQEPLAQCYLTGHACELKYFSSHIRMRLIAIKYS